MDSDLDDLRHAAIGLLEAGAAEAASPWRNVTLGSTGLDGAPRLRTVVLRAFEREAMVAEIHTDVRSGKTKELQADPRAALHGWDAGRSVQLRATGSVQMHHRDEVAQAAWGALHGGSRQTYQADPGPGTVIGQPGEAGPHLAAARAWENFVVLRMRVDALEWLHIAKSGHRRALFRWSETGVEGMWLAP